MQAVLEIQTAVAWLEMLLVGGGVIAGCAWVLAKFGQLGYVALIIVNILSFGINYFIGRIVLQYPEFDGAGITNGSFEELHLVLLIYSVITLGLVRRNFKMPVLVALTAAAIVVSYFAVHASTSSDEVRLGTSDIA
jgi:hypothetical protein